MSTPAISAHESLLVAANELDEAQQVDGHARAGALRDSAAAIEHHLDTLTQELATGGRLPPRLRPVALDIEARLRSLLVRCWEAERAQVGAGSSAEGLRALATDMREAATDDLKMVFDTFRDTGVAD